MGKLLVGVVAVVLALVAAFVLYGRWAGRWTSEVTLPPPVAAPASLPQPARPTGSVSLAQARLDQQRQAAAAASAPPTFASAESSATQAGSGTRCENLLLAGTRLHAWWRGSGAAPEAALVVREPRPEGARGDFTASFTLAGSAAQEPVRGRWSDERFFLTRTATNASPGPQQWEGRCLADGTIRGRWSSAADGESGSFRLVPP
jgi:hypothetical protein